MELLIDEEVLQGVMDMPVNDDQDLDDSYVLLNVSSKEAFLEIETLKITCSNMRKIYQIWYVLQNILRIRLNLVHRQIRNKWLYMHIFTKE